MKRWSLAGLDLDLSQPLAAGIVNVTTDSMFEGARSGTPERAVADGLALVEAGFDMLDVGAVAARSGPPVAAEEEAAALVPAIEGLAGAGVPISADTFSVEVARRALAAGAAAVNDISGGSDEMFELVAASGCGYVLMHIEGPPRVDRAAPDYDDVVDHLRAWFGGRVERALAALASARSRSRSTPASTSTSAPRRTWRSCAGSASSASSGCRSTSRSRARTSSARSSPAPGRSRLPAAEREWGTVAAVALAVRAGADILRIHDRSALQAIRVAAAIRGAVPA